MHLFFPYIPVNVKINLMKGAKALQQPSELTVQSHVNILRPIQIISKMNCITVSTIHGRAEIF